MPNSPPPLQPPNCLYNDQVPASATRFENPPSASCPLQCIMPPPLAAGYGCNASHAEVCPPGTYSGVGIPSCEPCSAGYACPSRTVDKEHECPTGAYADTGDGVCTACESGAHAGPWLQPKGTRAGNCGKGQGVGGGYGAGAQLTGTMKQGTQRIGGMPSKTVQNGSPNPTQFMNCPDGARSKNAVFVVSDIQAVKWFPPGHPEGLEWGLW